MKNKNAFTLTELIIGISISAIVLLVVLTFISNVMSDFWKSRKKTEFITTLYDFTTTVNEYRSVFDNATVINQWGHDVLFLYSTGSTWVIFWLTDGLTGTFDSVSNTDVYSQKLIGYRELTATQVTDTLSDSSGIYDYWVFSDKIFRDMVVSWFELTEYNSGSLINLDLELIIYYKDSLDGINLENLTLEDIFELTLTF